MATEKTGNMPSSLCPAGLAVFATGGTPPKQKTDGLVLYRYKSRA